MCGGASDNDILSYRGNTEGRQARFEVARMTTERNYGGNFMGTLETIAASEKTDGGEVTENDLIKASEKHVAPFKNLEANTPPVATSSREENPDYYTYVPPTTHPLAPTLNRQARAYNTVTDQLTENAQYAKKSARNMEFLAGQADVVDAKTAVNRAIDKAEVVVTAADTAKAEAARADVEKAENPKAVAEAAKEEAEVGESKVEAAKANLEEVEAEAEKLASSSQGTSNVTNQASSNEGRIRQDSSDIMPDFSTPMDLLDFFE